MTAKLKARAVGTPAILTDGVRAIRLIWLADAHGTLVLARCWPAAEYWEGWATKLISADGKTRNLKLKAAPTRWKRTEWNIATREQEKSTLSTSLAATSAMPKEKPNGKRDTIPVPPPRPPTPTEPAPIAPAPPKTASPVKPAPAASGDFGKGLLVSERTESLNGSASHTPPAVPAGA